MRMGLKRRGILRVGYVAIGLPNLKEAQRFYRDTMGLLETVVEEKRVYYRCWHEPFHHSLLIEQSPEPRLIEIGLEVRDGQDLDDFRKRLQAEGLAIEEDDAIMKGLGRSFAFRIPGGQKVRLFDAMAEVGYVTGYESPDWNVPKELRGTPAPLFLGHIAITVPRPPETIGFLKDILGFQISEWIRSDESGEPISALMFRTSYGQDIAVFPGKEGGLHHIAFVKTDEVEILNDSTYLVEEGVKIDLYGFTLQPYGKTYSLYFFDPFGVRLELFSGGRFSELHPGFRPVVWSEKELKKALSYYDEFFNEQFLASAL